MEVCFFVVIKRYFIYANMSNNKVYPDFSVLMSLYIKERAEYFDECMQSILNQTVVMLYVSHYATTVMEMA